MDKTLSQNIKEYEAEIDRSDISAQRRRHLNSQLNDLKKYQENHPNENHNPTPLELYCDLNPDALECRIYED